VAFITGGFLLLWLMNRKSTPFSLPAALALSLGFGVFLT